MYKRARVPIILENLRKLDFPKKLGICERLYGQKLANLGVVQIECANGVVWNLDLREVGHRWMVYGYYEGGIGIKYAASKLKNGGVYVDSGANIGQWITYLSQIKNLQTYAFEPNPTEGSWLKTCLANYSHWNVDVIDKGLSDDKHTLEMQCDGPRSTLRTDWYKEHNNDIITIDLDRLDTILLERDVDDIDFWKLDVEGAELEALRGAEHYLRQKRIKSIYLECHPSNFKQIAKYLANHGYAMYRLTAGGRREIGADYPAETEDFLVEPQ